MASYKLFKMGLFPTAPTFSSLQSPSVLGVHLRHILITLIPLSLPPHSSFSVSSPASSPPHLLPFGAIFPSFS